MLQKVKERVENSFFLLLKFSFSFRWEGAFYASIFSAFIQKFSLIRFFIIL